MQRHVKIYMQSFDYGIDDFIPCEYCGGRCVDVHHINGRGKGKDVIENLMGLCRLHHTDAEMERIPKQDLIIIHTNFMLNFKKRLP